MRAGPRAIEETEAAGLSATEIGDSNHDLSYLHPCAFHGPLRDYKWAAATFLLLLL